MDQKTYLIERVDDQISWYNKKSKINQTRYKSLKTIVIIVSVSIPVLAGMISDGDNWLKIVVGICGASIAGVEGILSLFKFQDLWLQYRLTAEMLEREKIIFLTGSGPYENSSSAFKNFVINAESIMGNENQTWLENQQKENTKDPA